jgi:hypothetical protein
LGASLSLWGLSAQQQAILSTDWAHDASAALPGWPAGDWTVAPLIRPARASADAAPLTARHLHGEVGGLREATRLLLAAGQVVLDPARRLLGLGPGAPPEALSIALHELHRSRGLLPLHAAVLTGPGPDGRTQTVAITGPSGAGKSTAALRLLGRGWTLVAEDTAWLHPPSLTLLGWDRGLRLVPGTLQQFAPSWLRHRLDAPLDAAGKQWIELPRQPGPHRLDRVVVLGPPLSAVGMVAAAWTMTGLPLTVPAQALAQAGVQSLLTGVNWQGLDREAVIAALST